MLLNETIDFLVLNNQDWKKIITYTLFLYIVRAAFVISPKILIYLREHYATTTEILPLNKFLGFNEAAVLVQ